MQDYLATYLFYHQAANNLVQSRSSRERQQSKWDNFCLLTKLQPAAGPVPLKWRRSQPNSFQVRTMHFAFVQIYSWIYKISTVSHVYRGEYLFRHYSLDCRNCAVYKNQY